MLDEQYMSFPPFCTVIDMKGSLLLPNDIENYLSPPRHFTSKESFMFCVLLSRKEYSIQNLMFNFESMTAPFKGLVLNDICRRLNLRVTIRDSQNKYKRAYGDSGDKAVTLMYSASKQYHILRDHVPDRVCVKVIKRQSRK